MLKKMAAASGQCASIATRPLAISDSRISAQGLMSRASNPGSVNDTTRVMHRSNIHASLESGWSLVFTKRYIKWKQAAAFYSRNFGTAIVTLNIEIRSR